MEDLFVQKIQKVLNEELIKRLLRKYFHAKGLSESMDKPIYPPIVQDLVKFIPQLIGKIEIVPNVENIDPHGGDIKIEWNMFVLGTNRMYLGESEHRNLAEINQIQIGSISQTTPSVKKATPNKIVEFVTKILSKSRAGIINPKKNTQVQNQGQPSQYAGKTSFGGSQGFEQNRPVL